MEIKNVRTEKDLIIVEVEENKETKTIAIKMRGSLNLQDIVIGFWDDKEKVIYY